MTLSVLQDLPCLEPVVPLDVSNSNFRRVDVLEHVSLLPCYVGRLTQGIIEHLNEKVFRFSDQLKGIVLSYSRPQVLQGHGVILDEQPHVHFDLKYSVYLFKPQLGSLMCGVVNNVGRDHIGCLVHNCFNASILEPSSTAHLNSWSSKPFEIGSTVWFTITNLENVGGIVCMTGEYYDLNAPAIDAEEQQSTSGIVPVLDNAKSSKKTKNKAKKSKKHKSVDVDTSESENVIMTSMQEHGSDRKKKRKHHHKDSEDDVPKAKRTKHNVETVKHKKKSKRKM